MLVSSPIIGLPIGFAQWIAFRRVAPISILWIITFPAGLFLGLVVTPMFGGIWGFHDDESVLSLTAGYTTIGLLVGLAQWLFLRGQFTKSLVWPLSSAVGLGLGTGLVIGKPGFYRMPYRAQKRMGFYSDLLSGIMQSVKRQLEDV